MSATRQITLWCDYPGCVEWIELNETLLVEARKKARGYGWRRTARKDLCPEHRNETVADA
jgi:hypothetical protein